MSRLVVQPYRKGSKSVNALSSYLGCKKLLVTGSRFVGKTSDTVINWGSQKEVRGNARVLNKPSAVYKASNKLVAFKCMQDEGVSIPNFYSNGSVIPEGMKLVARTKLSGHSGEGIEIIDATVDGLMLQAPLYTEYISKVKEYRCIVVGNEVVDTKQKKKRSSPRDEQDNIIEEERINHDEHVWNLDGGYVFARSGVVVSDECTSFAVRAVSALGLDFGAVDIIEDASGALYVLEVNTAFGLEGTTIELVGEAIKELL